MEMLLDLFSNFLQSGAINVLDTSAQSINESKFLGMTFWDGADVGKLLFRLSMNTLFLMLIVRAVYYAKEKRKDFLFTYLTIGTTVFTLCFVLENVNLDLAFALGLFAIFGIIRYRTAAIPIKEMSYLFIVIGVSVMNALVNKKVSYAELLIANAIIVLLTVGLERVWLLKHETNKMVIYERIEMIQKGSEQALMDDLRFRTGLDINRYEVEKIDFLKDTANIRVFFFKEGNTYSDRNISDGGSED